jgi:hypothetical protein
MVRRKFLGYSVWEGTQAVFGMISELGREIWEFERTKPARICRKKYWKREKCTKKMFQRTQIVLL